jgi:hypothetical protein
MTHQIDEGAQILRAAVEVDRPHAFKQTGALVCFATYMMLDFIDL